MEEDHVPLCSHGFYELVYRRNGFSLEYMLGPNRYRFQRGTFPSC